ncbi:MAG: hypothetical protein NC917_04290 [Candidatus Omnitrophica bacterium]|nr:hypothetical protein [Candidatus Omnitrophota bacterium]MCM8810850.1 hypothetical protein [Candidatus Omnitrophota bacterium]
MEILNENLKEWEKFYNYYKPHAWLYRKTPYEKLKEKLTSINVTTYWQTYTFIAQEKFGFLSLIFF